MDGRDAIVLNEFERGWRYVVREACFLLSRFTAKILCSDPGDSIVGGGYREVVLRTLVDPAQLVRSCARWPASGYVRSWGSGSGMRGW